MKYLFFIPFLVFAVQLNSQSLVFTADSAFAQTYVDDNTGIASTEFPIGYTMTEDPMMVTTTYWKFLDAKVPAQFEYDPIEIQIGLPPSNVLYDPNGTLNGAIENYDITSDFIEVWFPSLYLGPDSRGGQISFTIEFSDGNQIPFDTIILTTNVCGEEVFLPMIEYMTPTPFCPSSEIAFSAPPNFSSYLWFDGSTTQDASFAIGIDGFVDLNTIDQYGCAYMDMQIIDFNIPAPQPLCFVTVDNDSGKNKLLWEKDPNQEVVSFNIYKQGVAANQFDLIANQPFDELSEYVDDSSNPLSQSERYQITAVDGCETESFEIGSHKTIHLTSNVGINGEVNLIWEPYAGMQYPTFNIYRGTSSAAVALIGQRPSNTFTYTDFDAPSGDLFYQIEIEAPQDCNPSRAVNAVRSNVSEAQTVGLNDLAYSDFKIFPNPTTESISLYNVPKSGLAQIFNSLGQQVLQIEVNENETISLIVSKLPTGSYKITIEGIAGSVNFSKL